MHFSSQQIKKSFYKDLKVWPDGNIQVAQFLSKIAQKLTRDAFQKQPKKLSNNFGYLSQKFFTTNFQK